MALKDTFFISHGIPSLAVDCRIGARKYFRAWKYDVFNQRPTSILIISAHWDTTYPMVNVIDGVNDTMYDFYGYRKQMYKVKYRAPGAPELARKVKELLTNSGFKGVGEDTERGLDHGAWVPLYLMYPEANIPVCQLSIQSNQDATHHYNLGKALAPLKDEGVLIIGSGGALNNLRRMNPCMIPYDWAQQFDDWLRDALLEGRYQDVIHYNLYAPEVKMAHQRPDHIYPLHVAMGAAGDHSKAKLIFSDIDFSCVSYASYRFTSASD